MHTATSERELGFYDPHSRRSVVGFRDDGSPLWLTWRDASSVVLTGTPGSGTSHLQSALLRGLVKEVDVYLVDCSGDIDTAIGVLRDAAHTFHETTSERPRLLMVTNPSALERHSGGCDAVETFWGLADTIARMGRNFHTAVWITTHHVTDIPRVIRDSATVTVALRLTSERYMDALPFDMRGSVWAMLRQPRDTFPLVLRDVRSGIVTGSTLQQSRSDAHVGCDCVARATALLAAHAEHAA